LGNGSNVGGIPAPWLVNLISILEAESSVADKLVRAISFPFKFSALREGREPELDPNRVNRGFAVEPPDQLVANFSQELPVVGG
jgi:hypothetical protein